MPILLDHSAAYLSKVDREKMVSNERRDTDLLLSSFVSDIEVKLPFSRRPREIYKTPLPKQSWPRKIAKTYQANQVGSFIGNFDKSISSKIRAGNSVMTYEEYVHFRHKPDDACRNYIVNLQEYRKLETIHKLKSLELEDDAYENLTIFGPATLIDSDQNKEKILYTCAKYRCIFPCLCLLCTLEEDEIPVCEHRSILHPGFFDPEKNLFSVRNADSYNINFNEEYLTFGNQFCTNRTCSGCVSRYPLGSCGPSGCTCPDCPNCKSLDVYKYPGTDKQCSVCQNELLDHEAYHFAYHYSCRFCQESMGKFRYALTEQEYWDELKTRRDEELRSCRYCYKILYDRKTMERHISIVHDCDKLFSCAECNGAFGSKQALSYHDKVKHQKLDLELPCSICDKTFKFDEKLNAHMREVHRSFKVNCHICESSFKRQSALNHHYKLAHGMLINELYLENSSEIMEVFNCPSCDMVTREKRTLNHHIKFVHNKKDQEILECDQCEFRTIEKKSLNRHKKSHDKDNITLFSCDQCDYSTLEKSRLKNHKKIHDGIKPFQCDQCDFSYTEKKSLNRHKKIHEKDQTNLFSCDHCNYSTSEKFRLNNHKKTHNKEKNKPFHCNQCDFNTAEKRTLNRHKKIHEKDESTEHKMHDNMKTIHKKVYYFCDQCEFKTIEEKQLEVHSKSLHHQCNHCEFKTVFRKILRNHSAQVHSDFIPSKKFRFNIDDQ